MILVTGATGTVGLHLIAELVRAQVPTRALVRSPEKGAPLQAQRLDTAVGDLADAASLASALRGVERMFLLSPAGPDQVELERGAIDAAARAGVRHIVKLGARGADPASPARFLRAHGEVVEHLRTAGPDWTVLEPGDYMQNFLLNGPSIVRDRRWYRPAGDARVASVDCADIAAVAAAVLQGEGHAGDELEITGSESATQRELAVKLATVLGRDADYVETTYDDAREAMVATGMTPWRVDGLIELLRFYAEGGASATTDTVEQLVGRPPRTWEDFLRAHADAFGVVS
jgi:uncharacterized protein YbjT (DUF2867 family)